MVNDLVLQSAVRVIDATLKNMERDDWYIVDAKWKTNNFENHRDAEGI